MNLHKTRDPEMRVIQSGIERSHFEQSDLRECRFRSCDLRDVRIEDCNTEGLRVDGVLLSDLLALWRGQSSPPAPKPRGGRRRKGIEPEQDPRDPGTPPPGDLFAGGEGGGDPVA